jgi:Fic family protein
MSQDPRSALSGHYEPIAVAGVKAMAFIPAPLPPDLVVDSDLRRLLDRSLQALGALEAVAKVLPEAGHLLASYVRREAVLSSQIEGTRTTFAELLAYEAESMLDGSLPADLKETQRAVDSMELGLRRLPELPLSVRLLKEMHAALMGPGPKGSLAAAGELRRSQNWIGGSSPDKAKHVPPPAHRVVECLSAWERYLHRDEAHGWVAKAAFAHAQFESIHPFLDGNGRLGRQLLTLLSIQDGVLSGPWLWMSLALKRRRQEYYRRLNGTRQAAGWTPWLRFFGECLLESAEDARAGAEAMARACGQDRENIIAHGRRQMACLLVHESLSRRPVQSIKQLQLDAGLTPNAVQNALRLLMDLGLVRELSGRRRDRVFAYNALLAILDRGTESPAP